MKVLGVSGSLRRDSYNTKLLRTAAELLPEGVELELWDGLKAVPPYDEDDDGAAAPVAVRRLRAALATADADRFDVDGRLADDELREQLAELVRQLAATVEARRATPVAA